jgi:3-oxoacyl-[acyl-carrier-protein] synthase II
VADSRDNQLEPIVISGAGMITCLGLDRRTTWEAVRAGKCGMQQLTSLEQTLPEGYLGGQAPELPEDESPGAPREVRYLRRAMIDALRDAGLNPRSLPVPPQRAGIMLGTTLHGMRAGGEYLRSGSYAPLTKFLSASVIRSAANDLGLEGFAATTCSACSSALGAVALGVTLLREGKLDLIIAGGYDPISEYVYAGFNSLRLVTQGPLRPFARDRQGMKLAEGYAIVVLERASDAANRGAKPMATILGFGESADAHHLTQPHPQGDGAARAVRGALQDAGVNPADVDLIVAHATGTPDNDAGEYAALSGVFGSDLPRVPVVGFKSHLGHTLGGAGAVELILAATAMNESTVPPCANVKQSDTDFAGLNLAAGEARPAKIRATLSTSLGFGGANTAMVLGPAPAVSSPAIISRPATREVFVTGVGVVLPGAIGNDAFVRLLQSPPKATTMGDSGPIEDQAITHLINARRVRRLSSYVKYTLAAAGLAFTDAGVADVPAFCNASSVVLGTTHGSTGFSSDYYGQVVREGINAANPLLFAEGVPNAAAAHLSLMMSVKGACQTIIGSRTSGLDALRLATARISLGTWDRALVGAGEEYSDIISGIYRQCGGDEQPLSVGCGAVMLILESRESIESRGGRIRGRIDAVASAAPGNINADEAQRVVCELGNVDELIRSESELAIDRMDARAFRQAAEQTAGGNVSSLYGRVAECFSAGSLAGVAAALLNGGINGAADGKPRSIGVVCTDVTGLVSGVRVSKL